MRRYDAKRYADEMPDRLLRDLGYARILDAGDVLEGQRRDAAPLSADELDVVRWASQGLTDEMIGEVMDRSVHTIKSRLQQAMRKLSAKNRTHAVAVALRHGLID